MPYQPRNYNSRSSGCASGRASGRASSGSGGGSKPPQATPKFSAGKTRRFLANTIKEAIAGYGHDAEKINEAILDWFLRNGRLRDPTCRHTAAGLSEALQVAMGHRVWFDPRFVQYLRTNNLVNSKTTLLHFLFFRTEPEEDLRNLLDLYRTARESRSSSDVYEEFEQADEDASYMLETMVQCAVVLLRLGESFDTKCWGKGFAEDIKWVISEGKYGKLTESVLLNMASHVDTLREVGDISDEGKRNQAIYDVTRNLQYDLYDSV